MKSHKLSETLIDGIPILEYPFPPRFHSHAQYEGIWYGFEVRDSRELWVLADTQDGMQYLMFCNADYYRIDECLELFKLEYEKDKPNREYGKISKRLPDAQV